MLEQFVDEDFFRIYSEIADSIQEIRDNKSLSVDSIKARTRDLYEKYKKVSKFNAGKIREFAFEFVDRVNISTHIIAPKYFARTLYGAQPKEYLWSGISTNKKQSYSFQYSWVFYNKQLEISFCFGSAKNTNSDVSKEEKDQDEEMFYETVQRFVNLIDNNTYRRILETLINTEGFVLSNYLGSGEKKFKDIDSYINYITSKKNAAATTGLIKIFSKDDILSNPQDIENAIYKYFEIFKPLWQELMEQSNEIKQNIPMIPETNESKNSWTANANIPNLIGIKKIDLSIFRYGTHIPLDVIKHFDYANNGAHLFRGDKHEAKLLIDGYAYDASLINVNRKDYKQDTLQLRYEKNKDLIALLKRKFSETFEFIEASSSTDDGRKNQIIIPDELSAFIEFYRTDKPFEYKLQLIKGTKVNKSLMKMNEHFSIEELSRETGFDQKILKRWINALERKGQAIFSGPPGTGKTFLAKKIAKYLLSDSDGIVEIIQFHPAYAYEDFIQGIRPIINSESKSINYEMKPGRFIDFCEQVKGKSGKSILIIDEVNRANLSRVFGELMYLLEYRESVVPLAGGGKLSVPPNLLIIGTMNTADRSIALVDHALRRRFAFIDLRPNYDVVVNYHKEKTGLNVDGLVTILNKINRQIADPHYEIGISFFLREDLRESIEDIWEMEICSYLEEYFFDQPSTVEEFKREKIKETIYNDQNGVD